MSNVALLIMKMSTFSHKFYTFHIVIYLLQGHYKEHLQTTRKHVQHVANMFSIHVGSLGTVETSRALDLGLLALPGNGQHFRTGGRRK